ncbi:MAG: hypothetical protein LBB47_01825 [Spirochaetaceae bacterium]|jgi:hypothetical protein|nr:hypothetical protein [Spirochaetaceae bacterium]
MPLRVRDVLHFAVSGRRGALGGLSPVHKSGNFGMRRAFARDESHVARYRPEVSMFPAAAMRWFGENYFHSTLGVLVFSVLRRLPVISFTTCNTYRQTRRPPRKNPLFTGHYSLIVNYRHLPPPPPSRIFYNKHNFYIYTFAETGLVPMDGEAFSLGGIAAQSAVVVGFEP